MDDKNSEKEPIDFSFNIKNYFNYDFISKNNFDLFANNLFDLHRPLCNYFYCKVDGFLDIFGEYTHPEPLIALLHSKENLENGQYKFEKDVVVEFNKRFYKLFNFSHNNNLFYHWCSINVYQQTIEERFRDYENEMIVESKFDFMKKEYKTILHSYSFIDKATFLDEKNKIILKKSKEQKLTFLDNFFKENNFDVTVLGGENETFELFHLSFNESKNYENDSDDLSETSAIEKILYLKKLGVLEFLKTKQPFCSSTNSLATILSAITGEKAGTIQPMLNPIFSKNVDDKNHPENSQRAVNKVTNQLIQIGFNLDKTI